MAVGVAVVVLIAVVLILISVTVCLRQRKKKLLITTENVAYGTSSVNMELKDNIAYTSTAHEETEDDGKYDYVSRSDVTATPYTSTATGEETKDDDGKYDYVSRSDVTATPSNVPVAANQAYGVVES